MDVRERLPGFGYDKPPSATPKEVSVYRNERCSRVARMLRRPVGRKSCSRVLTEKRHFVESSPLFLHIGFS